MCVGVHVGVCRYFCVYVRVRKFVKDGLHWFACLHLTSLGSSLPDAIQVQSTVYWVTWWMNRGAKPVCVTRQTIYDSCWSGKPSVAATVTCVIHGSPERLVSEAR